MANDAIMPSTPKPTAPKVPSFSPNTTPATGQASVNPLLAMTSQVPPTPIISPVTSNAVGSTPGGTATLESLMSQVLAELKSINGNTGYSSNQLESLNKNGVQDMGVRDSITQLGKNKPARKPQVPYSAGNTRSVSAMIRP
jgi:hypothetical protein